MAGAGAGQLCMVAGRVALLHGGECMVLTCRHPDWSSCLMRAETQASSGSDDVVMRLMEMGDGAVQLEVLDGEAGGPAPT